MSSIVASIGRARSGAVVAAIGLGAAATAVTTPDAGRGALWAFLLAAVVGELIVLEDVRGSSAPASVAVLAAFALLEHPPFEVAGVAVVAWLVAASIGAWRGRAPSVARLAERMLAAWTLGALASLGAVVQPSAVIGTEGSGVTIGGIVAVLVGLLIVPAVLDLAGDEPMGRSSVVARIAQGGGVAVALGASAALVAVAHGLLGAGALLLLLPPVLAVRAGLKRYVDIRRTYDQTVIAMSRMTELTGHAEPGHGVRVAELAVDIGRELGMSGRDLRVLERAAHLHELGRIVTDDPERAAKDREVAVAGAAIVREAGGMDGVADIIERHRDSFRGFGRAPDRSLPQASRIVHAACEFDRLVRGSSDHDRWAALDVLQSGSAHDPQVVSALFRLVSS